MTGVAGVVVVVGLLALAVAVRYGRSRAWLVACVRGLAARFERPEHTPAWEQEHAELWLMARRRQLIEDLSRIERLLLHDECMSATRQLGNRLAKDQLVASLAQIPDVLPGRDRYFRADPVPYEALGGDQAAPSPSLAKGRPTVEVLDVVGWR